MKKILLLILIPLFFVSQDSYASCRSDFNWAGSKFDQARNYFNTATANHNKSHKVDADVDEYIEAAISKYNSAIQFYQIAINEFQDVYDDCSGGIDDVAWDNKEKAEESLKKAEKRIEKLTDIKKGRNHLKIARDSDAQAQKKIDSAVKLLTPRFTKKINEIAPLKQAIQILNSAKPYYNKSEASYKIARDYLGKYIIPHERSITGGIVSLTGGFALANWYIESAEKRIKELTQELNNEVKLLTKSEHGIDMPFIWVEGGCYQMGSSDNNPGHKVCVDGFWMGKYEVTAIQWEAIMKNHPSYNKNRKKAPVNQVSWNDVQSFLQLLNSKAKKPFRLPTEAEWEYAARSGGKNQIYAGGNSIDDFAWYEGTSAQSIRTIKKLPNGLGIYNMSGNALEWCQDWYGENYYQSSPVNNPQGPASGTTRVTRGGSYHSTKKECRVTNRDHTDPLERFASLGFRIILSSSEMKGLKASVSKTAGDVKYIDQNNGAKKVSYVPGENIILNASEHGIDLELVWIDSGCYQMGSNAGEADEKPVHKVCVDGFWMAKHEMTNKNFKQFRPDHDSKSYQGVDLNSDEQPVVWVEWDDTKVFIAWLNQKTGQSFALPTEAQWEFAARGGTDTIRFWGDNQKDAGPYANVYDISSDNKFNIDNLKHHMCEDQYAATAPVGSFKPNSFGLHDMLGNVWELCADVYDKRAYYKHTANNPLVTSGSRSYVMRGGGWQGQAVSVRSANRGSLDTGLAESKDNWIGFRLALSPDKQ